MQYLVACSYCSHPVVTTPQIAVADWVRMRTHLKLCAARTFPVVPETLGDLLAHFRVQRVPETTTIH